MNGKKGCTNMALDWVQLVKERDEWVAKNFPPYDYEVPGNDSVLGCIEELGELAHAHLKSKQGIRGSQDEHDAAAKDAIGDLIVYLLGVISARHVTVGLPRTGAVTNSTDQAIFAMSYHVGILSLYAEHPQMVSSNHDLYVNSIIKHAEEYCDARGWNFEEIVQSTWDHVKQRDWNAHRAAGAPADDPTMKDPEGNDVGGAMRYLNSKD